MDEGLPELGAFMYSDSYLVRWTRGTTPTQRNLQEGRLWLPQSTGERVVPFGMQFGYVSVRLRTAELEATPQRRAVPLPCGSGYLASKRGTSPLLIIIDERVSDHALLRGRSTPSPTRGNALVTASLSYMNDFAFFV